MVQPLWRTVWRFPNNLKLEKKKNLKLERPCDPEIALLGIYLEKNMIGKDTGTPMFIAALFTTAKTWDHPKCPLIEEWIKMWYIYAMEYYSAIKKNEITHLQQPG